MQTWTSHLWRWTHLPWWMESHILWTWGENLMTQQLSRTSRSEYQISQGYEFCLCFLIYFYLSIVQVGSYWIPSTIWKSTEPYRKFHPWTRWEGTDIRVIFFLSLFLFLDFLTYKVHSFSVFMRNIRPAVYFVALCLDMICHPCYFRQVPLWSLQFWTQRDASGQWLLEVVLVSYTLIL